jgi:hypothetical protein
MKNKSVALFSIMVIAAAGLMITYAQAPKQQAPKPKSVAAPHALPLSLDHYFPPIAQEPVFLFRMMGMAKPLTGVIADLQENDLENARANYQRFKTQYVEVSKLVPEWKTLFPLAPINGLGTALQTAEPAKVMAAIEPVANVCSGCHQVNQPKAFFKYHWGDFHAIKTTDPLSKQEVDFAQLMLFLEVNFSGAQLDVEQAQIENTRKQFQGFRSRFQAVSETCMHCHDTERHYFIDKNIKEMIDKLDQAYQANPVDATQIDRLIQGIGTESCFKCHLVHVPASAAQLTLKPH